MSIEEVEYYLLKNLDQIDSRVERLGANSRYVFGLCALERLFPVYQRASVERGQDGSGSVLPALDLMWNWIQTGGNFAAKWHGEELTKEGKWVAEAMDTDTLATVRYHAIQTVLDFLLAIGRRDSGYSKFTATRNIDTIELLSDSGSASMLQTRGLYEREFSRQQEDFEDLLDCEIDTLILNRLRARSQGTSVLGRLWFLGI